MTLVEQAALFLLTAVIVVPLFRRMQLGAVLGYLTAGAIIGPWGLGLIADADATLNFAQMGVVLLLFLIGLELEPARLWALRHPVFGLGGAQVVVTGIVITGIAVWWGLSWQAAIVVGFGLAMSSTAIVLAWLRERGQLSSPSGRNAFAILLFQDVAVIPLIALLPLLSPDRTGHESGWILAAKGVAAIAFVIVVSRLLVRPALKLVARFGGREVFTAAALLVVIGAALTMEAMGLSMSLGAFLAGVVLADSEFRHELEADIEPFKGLLLGLFFMAVGMSANLAVFVSHPLAVLGLVLGLMALKTLLMYGLARASGTRSEEAQRIAVLIAQGGEFAFVLFVAAQMAGILAGRDRRVSRAGRDDLNAPRAALVHRARSHSGTLARAHEATRVRSDRRPGQSGDHRWLRPLWTDVSRVLRMAGIPFTALEASFQQVDFVRRFGNKVYYGDASRLELLESARARDAEALRAGHRRPRGLSEDGGGRPQEFSQSSHSRAGAQSRSLLPPARPRHRRQDH